MPCGVAQLPREDREPLEQQAPSLEPAIPAGPAAAERAGCALCRGACAGLSWPRPALSAPPASTELTFQTCPGQTADGQGTGRQRALFPHKRWLRRSAVGRGLESCIPPKVTPHTSQSSSDQQQSLTGCLHPSASSLYRSRSFDFALVPVPAEHRTKARLQLSSSAFTPTLFVKR